MSHHLTAIRLSLAVIGALVLARVRQYKPIRKSEEYLKGCLEAHIVLYIIIPFVLHTVTGDIGKEVCHFLKISH